MLHSTLVEEPIPRVLELDKSQPEFVQTFAGYMRNRLSDARIERGKSLLVEHKDLFNRIQQQYGVQPHYLVSFWALESNFGDFTGGFSVVNALATLAYDPRRSDFFRSELLTALRIIEEGHIPVEQMSGSWAGAMGQCQFMPSTFYAYARDGDGDGRVDIWNSVPDVFASAANYLSQNGWQGDERWGREVILPDGFDFTQTGTGVRKTVTQWNSLGIRRVNGNAHWEMPTCLAPSFCRLEQKARHFWSTTTSALLWSGTAPPFTPFLLAILLTALSVAARSLTCLQLRNDL